MTPFQWIVAPLLTGSAIVCVLRVRRGTLPRFGGLVWAAVWLGGTFLVLWPGLTTSISSLFGIGRGADFIFYLALVGGLYALLALYRRMRHLETALTELGREQAIRDATPPSVPGPTGDESTATRDPERGM
jgi:hypothetical protein